MLNQYFLTFFLVLAASGERRVTVPEFWRACTEARRPTAALPHEHREVARGEAAGGEVRGGERCADGDGHRHGMGERRVGGERKLKFRCRSKQS